MQARTITDSPRSDEPPVGPRSPAGPGSSPAGPELPHGAGAPTDEELMRCLRGGDAQALRALMDRYARPLHGYLFRMLGSAQDAEDLFQDAFLRVLRHVDRFEPGRRFRPWLYAIAGNLVKNKYRSRSYRDALSLDRPASGGEADAEGPSLSATLRGRGVAPGEAIEREEARRRVREAVERLPEKGRAALVLYYFQGLPYEEVAEALEIPLGTVKSRIHNAMAKLSISLDAALEAGREEP